MQKSSIILRMSDLIPKLGLGKTSIYRLIKEDGFPKPIKLTRHSVGWYEHEIDEWLLSRERAGGSK